MFPAVNKLMSSERNRFRITFESVAARAKEIVLQDGHHMPLLIVEGSSGVGVAKLSQIPETHDDRVRLMRLYGEAAATGNQFGRLRQVFFISEGWMSVGGMHGPPQVRPSQDPNRREVLVVAGLEMAGLRRSLRLFEMIRTASHDLVDLAELIPPQDKGGRIEIPLLDAFVDGFQSAFGAKTN